MIIKKDLTLKLFTTGQDVLQKLQRQCVTSLLVSLSNRSSSRRILEILSLNFELADNKVAIDCMLKAIDQHQKSMPPSLQQIYKEIKTQLEAKKAGF